MTPIDDRRGRLRREGRPDLGGDPRVLPRRAGRDGRRAVLELRGPGGRALRGARSTSRGTRTSRTCGRPRETDGACRVLAMRDTDVEFFTLLVGRAGELARPADLQGQDARARQRRLGAGRDHAGALPAQGRACARRGDRRCSRFDSDVGKHGDTGRSEREALEAVLERQGRRRGGRGGVVGRLRASGRGASRPAGPFWTSPPYSHCNFTALPSLDQDAADAWTPHLRAMDWEDPEHRRILELEGLREWVGPQLDGYRDVFEAVEEQGISARW